MKKSIIFMLGLIFVIGCTNTATTSNNDPLAAFQSLSEIYTNPTETQFQRAHSLCDSFGKHQFDRRFLELSNKTEGETYYQACMLVGTAYQGTYSGALRTAANAARVYNLGKDKVSRALRTDYRINLDYDPNEKNSGAGAYSAMHLALNNSEDFSQAERDYARDRYAESNFGRFYFQAMREIIVRRIQEAKNKKDENIAANQIWNLRKIIPRDEALEQLVLSTTVELALDNNNCEIACSYVRHLDEPMIQRAQKQCPINFRCFKTLENSEN